MGSVAFDTVEKCLDIKVDTVEERLNAKIGSVEEHLIARLDSRTAALRPTVADWSGTFGREAGEVKTRVAEVEARMATAFLTQLCWRVGLILGMPTALIAAVMLTV